ncbi:MAG: NAD(P)H-quinone oxidoreductase [Chloroflexota bacterium]
MKAITVYNSSTEPRLVWEQVADVGYGPDEVLVDVRATAVNRADLSQARGHYPPPPGASEILGLEMAGVIRAVGVEVTGWQVGERVCALLPGGGYAEQSAVHHLMLLRLPDDWSFEQGAAVPEVWYTAFVNLFLEGGLKAGETVLIHAGASGVGTAAIQLAREAGAEVLVTAGGPAKVARCLELGARVAIDYKTQDFAAEAMAATAGRGVDVILDCVGGSYLGWNLSLLREKGRLVCIGLLGGGTAEINLGLLLARRLRVVGSTLRRRPLAEKIEITRQFKEQVWPGLVSGRLRPVIDSIFPIRAAQAAHDYVRQNRNVGKVVLKV